MSTKIDKPYRVPKTAFPIDLRLDGNEGQPPPAALLAGLEKLGGEVLRRYPDVSSLERLLARRLGVSPDRVLASNGGDDLIDRICKATLGSRKEIVFPSPSFVMIERFARVSGATVRKVPWQTGPYPTQDVLKSVDRRTGLVAMVSPNNPTGAVATTKDLRAVARKISPRFLLVDLAYTEFADRDLPQAALSLPNTIVLRTLSKAWGLAGLRVGYVAGPAPLIERLRACGSPYALPGLSALVAERWVRQ